MKFMLLTLFVVLVTLNVQASMNLETPLKDLRELNFRYTLQEDRMILNAHEKKESNIAILNMYVGVDTRMAKDLEREYVSIRTQDLDARRQIMAASSMEDKTQTIWTPAYQEIVFNYRQRMTSFRLKAQFCSLSALAVHRDLPLPKGTQMTFLNSLERYAFASNNSPGKKTVINLVWMKVRMDFPTGGNRELFLSCPETTTLGQMDQLIKSLLNATLN